MPKKISETPTPKIVKANTPKIVKANTPKPKNVKAKTPKPKIVKPTIVTKSRCIDNNYDNYSEDSYSDNNNSSIISDSGDNYSDDESLNDFPMKVKFRKGDIFDHIDNGDYDVVVHGCNCFHSMGGGFAKLIKDEFPLAYEADKQTKHGDKSKLGSYSKVKYPHVSIINAYTQYKPSNNSGEDVFEYRAFTDVLKKIKKEYNGKRIAMPKIGAGLAGGNWDDILNIIMRELNNQDVTIVVL